MDDKIEEVLIFEDITYEQPIEVWHSFISNVIDQCLKYEDLDAYAAGRATESWALLYREAPLLAWPMLICILLQHLPGTATVTYVLTEDAHESSVNTVDEAWKYLDDYWEVASEGLAAQAEILGRLFGVLAGFESKLGRHFWFARATEAFGRLDKLNGQTDEVSTKARGDALESLVDALLRTEEPELQVVAKNFRTTEEEIDVVLTNGLTNPFWTSQASPLILVECKNWTSKVGVPELRVFESKMQDRGAIEKIGIFVSTSGFTAPFMERLKVIQGHGGVIFAVSGRDLFDVITRKTRLTDWLRSEGVLRALGK
jgi:Holliday junction resolvase-like predicted endonuclease